MAQLQLLAQVLATRAVYARLKKKKRQRRVHWRAVEVGNMATLEEDRSHFGAWCVHVTIVIML